MSTLSCLKRSVLFSDRYVGDLSFQNSVISSVTHVQKMKKLRFSWLTIFFAAIVIAKDSNGKINVHAENKIASDFCATRDCFIINTEYGLNMVRNMNTSVDPCDNFYEFACGNFDDPFSFGPKIDKYYEAATMILDARVGNLITESRRSFKIKQFKFISDYYLSCKNTYKYQRSIDDDDIVFLNEIISRLGGWPVVEGDNWNSTNFDWIKFIDDAENIGYFERGFLQVGGIMTNGTLLYKLELPYAELSKQELLNNFLLDGYYRYMSNVAKFLGADRNRTKELKKSLEFEKSISNLINEFQGIEENTTNLMSVKEMREKWPGINWIDYLNLQTRSYFNFTNNTIVDVKYPKFVTGFEKLISSTPKRVQANYVLWNLIHFSIPLTKSKSLFDYYQSYMKFKGPLFLDSKYDKCFELVKNSLGSLLQAFYVREYPVDKSTKDAVTAIFYNVKDKLIDNISKTTWLDGDTRNMLLDKIKSIKSVIGYTDELLDDEKLTKYFEGLHITRSNFLRNNFSANYFNNNKLLLEVFNKPQAVDDGIELFDFSLKLQNNGGYTASCNLLEITIELLRNDFFNINRFNYLNYGVIGQIIGHEFSHAVDNNNRLLNKFGIEHKWSDVSNDIYREQEACIVNQYQNYFIGENGDEVMFNDSRKIAEDIADNIGVKLAYLAYQDWVTKNGHEPNLPGLLYTPNQLFWLSFANEWCQSKSSHYSKSDEHSPQNLRVIGPLSNSVDFSRDFNCPIGSNMNPPNKCHFF